MYFCRAKETYRIFNTWMGDPGKILLLEAVLEVIKKDNLLCVAQQTGQKLKCGLLELEKEFCFLLDSTRGIGTLLAVNAATPQLRDEILKCLKQKGLHCYYTIDRNLLDSKGLIRLNALVIKT